MRSDCQPSEDQKDEAALWHAKRAGGSMSAQDEADFDAWMNADKANRLAFDQMRVLWARIEQPAQRAAQSRKRFGLSGLKRVFTKRRSLAGVAAIVMVCGVIWAANPNMIVNWQADIVAGTNDITTVTLPDGSTALLGANSALATDFTGNHREVRLLRGQVLFDVVHRDGDAFRVHTSDTDIEVVGTRFNVDSLSDKTVVTVERGAVRVSNQKDRHGVLLGPDQQARSNGTRVVMTDHVDSTLALSWMKGRLSVQNSPVRDVVAKLQNYSTARLIVLGDAGNSRVSGSFPTRDVDGSLKTVADAVGAKVIETSPWVTILY
ncbi:FecR family protein [Thalassospira sp.]|uniref:FecR family protein n=1 Tax=Thalassospira sp. TaxID=1912094 RepID=UPI003AA8FEF9